MSDDNWHAEKNWKSKYETWGWWGILRAKEIPRKWNNNSYLSHTYSKSKRLMRKNRLSFGEKPKRTVGSMWNKLGSEKYLNKVWGKPMESDTSEKTENVIGGPVSGPRSLRSRVQKCEINSVRVMLAWGGQWGKIGYHSREEQEATRRHFDGVKFIPTLYNLQKG